MPDIARLTTVEILSARGAKNAVDPQRPYAFLVEEERSAAGEVVPIATLFLTNRECPYRCLMCDLWQNTTDETVPPGAIPAQIDYALERLPPARQIKLYNSGNFFDPQAIPREDHAAIIDRVRRFENVIVENHPRLTNDACVRFSDQLGTRLEVAIGLETIHPGVLPALNKQMTVADFDEAARFLITRGIAVRAFILLRPPYLSEEEGVNWAIRAIDHAFHVGVGCCSVIATRAGNGIMERLQAAGSFGTPTLRSLEEVLAAGIGMQAGRVFVDLWGAEQFGPCESCCSARIARLRRMNLSQAIEPAVVCDCRT
jgi:radical SAM enzyme (TIGR01210 family)